MKYYDISQEVFGGAVYPGDSAPVMRPVCRMANGALYNLTELSMCAHNGTHIDAPFHFWAEGKTVEAIPLEKTVGHCCVVAFEGSMGAGDAEAILHITGTWDASGAKKLLLKGDVTVTAGAARVFAASGLDLLGVESQSVGDAEHPMEVHRILLEREIVLLEGIRLKDVAEGVYFLSAAPLALGGSDGAPCRAILIKEE